MPYAKLAEALRALLSASSFHCGCQQVTGNHRKIWARLCMNGLRTSLRRILRLMREHNLLAPSRAGAPRSLHNHDGTIIPDMVDAI